MKKLVKESINESTYVVVSKDPRQNLWGEEGNFEGCSSEAEAIRFAKREMQGHHVDFHAFLEGSEELENFYDTHNFID